MPNYPADAFRAHQQGTVDVIVTVSASGEPVEAHVYQSSGTASLDSAAVAAVKAWTFRAAERNGNATEAQAIVTIDWSIGPKTVLAGLGSPMNPSSNMSTVVKQQTVVKQIECLQTSPPELCK
ncbi:energy transducer TonB [Dokdonella soli]